MINEEFEFEKYSNLNTGKPWIYIKFKSDDFRFEEHQKKVLKIICSNYFRWDRKGLKWTFPDRGMNEFNVYEYLVNGTIPLEKISEVSGEQILQRKGVRFDLRNFKTEFVNLEGRPLYFIELLEHGKILVNINLKHWFFVKTDKTEKDMAKKIVISLVGAQLSMTSKQIDFFLNELHTIMFSLKFDYDEH